VSLSQTSVDMTAGETLTLTATFAPSNATDKIVTWATSDAAVATVADGVVTAVGAGTATITAADHYVLSNGQDFVWAKDAGTLAAGKCWIELVPSSEAHARRLVIVHEGITTGIAGVSGKTADHTDCYDLSGRRVMQPTKGLYIIGGKKVVVK